MIAFEDPSSEMMVLLLGNILGGNKAEQHESYVVKNCLE